MKVERIKMYKEIISKVLKADEPILIPCGKDKARQESMRVMFFHAKKRVLPEGSENEIGISKFQYADDLFIKIYKRDILKLFTISENGVLVELEEKLIDQVANARQVKLMRADGLSDEEIEEALNE